MTVPRRTCMACARRYAGLVADDCPVCQGLGTLALGAAALAHHPTAAVARAVELYVETRAQHARATLPLAARRPALEAAVDNLRAAGVLHSTADGAGHHAHPPTPADNTAPTATEAAAYRLAKALGTPASTRVLATLAAPPVPTWDGVRPREAPPTASATRDQTATATIADPLDPIGPDTARLDTTRYAHDHAAQVLAAATDTAATQRRTRTPRP